MSTLWEAAEAERKWEDEQARKRTPCPTCSNPDTCMFGCWCELPAKPAPCSLCNDLGWRVVRYRLLSPAHIGGFNSIVVRCEAGCIEVPGALKDAQHVARRENQARFGWYEGQVDTVVVQHIERLKREGKL